MTLLATTKCGMSSVDEVPADLGETKAEQIEWLINLATYIVQFAWMPPDAKQIDLVVAAAAAEVPGEEEDYHLFCACGEGIFFLNS